MPDIRYSLKVKDKDKNQDWYKAVMDSIVPQHNTQLDSYQNRRMIYAIINNDITYIQKNIQKFCSPENSVFKLPFEEDREIVVFNPLFKYYMFLLGEMLKRGTNFDVLLLGDRDNKRKDQELTDLLSEKVEEYLAQAVQEVPEEQRVKPQEQDVTSFKSSMEIFYSDVLEYFKAKFDIKRIKSLSFKHVLAADMCFIDIAENNGIPEPVVYNTLNVGFHKSPDESKVEKGDFWWVRTAVTLSEAYDDLMDKVSQEELDRLGTYTSATQISPNKAWDVTSNQSKMQMNYLSVEEAYERRQFDERYIGQNTGSNNSNRLQSSRLLWKTKFQFKAFREVIFLTSIDEYGEVLTEIVSADFEIPKQAVTTIFTNKWGRQSKKYEWIDDRGNAIYAEILWIPRRYECTRYSDIIVDRREVPNQPINIDNPYDFELSLKGRIFTSLNAEPISLVQRAVSTLMQYIFVKDLQLRELSKYEGFIKSIDASKIPDYLALDENGQPLYEGADKLSIWRHFRRALGDSYYDSNENANGLPDYQKTSPVRAEVAGSIAEIVNMQNLLDLLDRQMGLEMLVPIQATGMYSASSNVTDNQAAVTSSYTMTEEYYHVHNDLMKSVLNEYLSQFTTYYKNYFEDNPDVEQCYLNYNLPDGSKKLLTIKPEYLDNEGLGIYLSDTTYNEDYRRTILQLGLQPLAQNRGEGVEIISELVMAITRGESPEKVHKMLVISAKKQREQAEAMQKQAYEQATNLEKTKQDALDKQHANKLEEINLIKDRDAEIAALKTSDFSPDKDVDKNGINDGVETMLAVKKIQLEEQKIAQQAKANRQKTAKTKKS